MELGKEVEKELETKLEMGSLLNVKELLTRDKQLKSLQAELQAEKQKMQSMQEVNTL